MRNYKEKRNLWVNEEIRCVLDLIKDLQQKTGTTATTHYTFIDIQNEMKNRGFKNKSAMQIRRKWFQLKSAYHCSKRGKCDRIALIPEEFREEIRNFVESEKKDCPGLGGKAACDVTLSPKQSQVFVKHLNVSPKMEPSPTPTLHETSKKTEKVLNPFKHVDNSNFYERKFTQFADRDRAVRTAAASSP